MPATWPASLSVANSTPQYICLNQLEYVLIERPVREYCQPPSRFFPLKNKVFISAITQLGNIVLDYYWGIIFEFLDQSFCSTFVIENNFRDWIVKFVVYDTVQPC